MKEFLATTALEDFWNDSGPLIFLGPECLRHSSRHTWEGRVGKIVESDINGHDGIFWDGAQQKARELAPVFADALNRVHGTNHSERYWQILVGPWLLFCCTILIRRLRAIDIAIEQCPDFRTCVLDRRDYLNPADTFEFMLNSYTDGFNLQIYSMILESRGMIFPSRRFEMRPPRRDFALGRRVRRMMKAAFNRAVQLLPVHRPVYLHQAYFPNPALLKLFAQSMGSVLPVQLDEFRPPACVADVAKRQSLLAGCSSAPDRDGEIVRLLVALLPACYLEQYDLLVHHSETRFFRLPSGIATANSLFYDESIKHWCGRSAERGCEILSLQHGGNYGITEKNLGEAHEIGVSSKFYTWGWNSGPPTQRMPAPKLFGIRKLRQTAGTEILMTTTIRPRIPVYPDSLGSPATFVRYLESQIRFLEELGADFRQRMRMRPIPQEFGWDVVQRWIDRYPTLTIDNDGRTFQESLRTARVFVSDHLSTTYAEALAADCPAILFWRSADYSIRPEAQPYFDMLRNVGVLHDTPQAAAAMLKQIYPDAAAWWTNAARRDAITRFREIYCWSPDNPVRLWTAEFATVRQSVLKAEVRQT